ncbi:MAG: glycosyltransferase family 4 protein [Saprospiraceae bacterium]
MIQSLQKVNKTTDKSNNQRIAKPVHYVMWRISRGGAEMSVLHYVDQFAEERSLHAYSLKRIKDNIFQSYNIEVTENKGDKWQRVKNYFRYCQKNRNHIFHLLNVGPLILLLTLLAGVKNPIYHIHGTKYYKKKLDFIYLKLAWLFSSLFKIIFVANSHYSAAIFKKQVLPIKPIVIYNGIHLNNFLIKRHLRIEPKRIAYAGRLHTGKNVDLVIRLFESIAEYYPDMELQIAGDGPLRPALEEQVQKSIYANRIHFLGFVKDMPSFYRSVDLFIFLSAYESFGNVLVEALLTGLPVLTSNIPAFEEIHGGDTDFILGDPNDFTTLKRKFIHALTHFPELAEKAFNLGDRIKDHFSVKQHIQEIANIYEQHKH